MNLTDRITAWHDRRTDCLAHEAADGASSRWGEEIQSYDDEAVALLLQAQPLVTIIERLGTLDLDMWADTATGFTCNEADVLAELVRIVSNDENADHFLRAHAEGDTDDTDRHAHLLDGADQ